MENLKLRNISSAPWLALIVIALAAFTIYSNTYQCPFVFDDLHSIAENLKIRDLTNFFERHGLLHSRMIVDLSFALNYKFGWLDVFGYHLVNILIHIANGVVVYFLSMTILGEIGGKVAGGRSEVGGQRSEVGRRKISSSKLQAESYKLKAQSSKPKVQGKKKKGKKNTGAVVLKQSAASNPRLKIQNSKLSVPLVSLFAALIFVVHPIQTQAVTYIVQRYASVAAFFYMASVLFYLRARLKTQNPESRTQNPKHRTHNPELKTQNSESQTASTFYLQPCLFYLLSFVCGILAFLSKQNAASLPGAILLVEYVCFGGTWKQRARRIFWITPAVVLFILFVLYNMGAFSGADLGQMLEDVSDLARETEDVTRWDYLCTQFNVLVIYIRLLLLPVNQNLDYIYPFKTGFFDGFTPFAFGLLAGLILLAVWQRKRYPVFFLAVFWFFITLSVESSLIPIRDALFEHRLYLSMFGFAFLAAWLTFRFLPGRRVAAVFICVLMVGTLGFATYLRNQVWRDPVTLWSDVLAKAPQNARACLNLGKAFAAKKRYEDATRCYRFLLNADLKNVKAYNNLGVVLKKQGDIAGAIRCYKNAIEVDSDSYMTHYNLGNLLDEQGDLEGAVRHYTEALRIKPENVKAHSNLGVVLSRMGNSEKALTHFQKALRIDPGNAGIRNNVGAIFEMKQNFADAAQNYCEALVQMPGYADALVNLTRVLKSMKDPAAAVQLYRRVLGSDSENADVHRQLGIAMSRMGDFKNALDHFRQAVRINPLDASARYNLGLALSRQKKTKEAIRQYSESLKLRSNNPKAHYNLALVLYNSGNFPKAIDHFKEVIALDSRMTARAAYDIARAFAQQADAEASIRWLNRAAMAGFQNPDRLAADPDLNSIKDRPEFGRIVRDMKQTP